MTTDTYPTPPHGWTCFHCGETFPPTLEGEHKARDHFGPTPEHEPGCVLRLTDPERTILHKLRRMEAALERYRAEDSDMDRRLAALRAEHEIEKRRAEELGFARGIAEAKC